MINLAAGQNRKSASWMGLAMLTLPGAVLLSSTLALTRPASANGFPQLEQRGSHGANHIVSPAKSARPALQSASRASQPERQQPVRTARKFTVLVQRGSHGANHVVNQESVGGPTGKYKGFPKLEQRGSHGAYRIVNQ